MWESTLPWIILAGLLLVVLALAGYAWNLYNELTLRRERLHSLLAAARLVKARRHAVSRAVRRHMGRCARHVENTTRRAANGKSGGRLVKLNMDGFPEQRLVDLAGRGMDDDIQSCGMETNAQVALRNQAAEYNTRLRCFPCCLIAPFLGFRPWNTHGSYRSRRGSRSRGRRRSQRRA